MKRVRVTARGVVQGVGFRYETRRTAIREGTTGWVRNRRDDSVEAEIEGPESAVAAVVEWMRGGPAGARVDELDVVDTDAVGDESFEITATA